MIDNEAAPVYQTINVNELNLDFENSSLEDLKTVLDEQLKSADYTRFDFADLPAEKITMIRKIYKDNSKIAVKVIDKKESLQQNSENNEFYEQYKYLLDDKLPVDEVIYRFIKEEYKKDIAIEYVRETITGKE